MTLQQQRAPYLEHFGLREDPFLTSPNPRYLYVSPTHEVAIEKTFYAVSAGLGLAICFGAVGTGKTTLARELCSRLDDYPEASYVLITNPSFSTPNQFLRAIMAEFEVVETSRNYMELLGIFKAFLLDQALDQGRTLALVIDEAQTLGSKLLELLRQLMNYETNDKKLLQIVLFAQEEFRGKLAHSRYRNLVNRTAMASTLDSLSPSDTAAMLAHRWRVAGGGTLPFTADAIDRIYALSSGVPRTQVILAGNALLTTYLTAGREVTADFVQFVTDDRNLPDTAPVIKRSNGRRVKALARAR